MRSVHCTGMLQVGLRSATSQQVLLPLQAASAVQGNPFLDVSRYVAGGLPSRVRLPSLRAQEQASG